MADKDNKKPGKFRRVAVEGQTVDGRRIERQDILDMADSYDYKVFGARIWNEHYRGFFPGNAGDALGDIYHVKAEEIKDGSDLNGLLGLYVSGEALPMLKKFHKMKQKIFASIEIIKNFRGTGKAYFAGLACTDSPASAGTEILAFSKNNKQEFLKFDSEEVEHEYFSFLGNDEDNGQGQDAQTGKSFFNSIKELIKGKASTDHERFTGIEQSIEAVAESQGNTLDQITQLTSQLKAKESEFSELKSAHKVLADEFKNLASDLEESPSQNYRQRPPAKGGNSSEELAEC